MPLKHFADMMQWLSTACNFLLKFTPNIRCQCKALAAHVLKTQEASGNIKVFDGFTERAARFLFVPSESLWQKQEKLEVQTILPDGSMESRSWLRRGKGIFGFVRVANLKDSEDVKPPYSFVREDKTKAVVRMWPKTVDQNLKNHFLMMKVTANLLNAAEQEAYMDFEQALVNLLGPEQVQCGSIYRCTGQTETVNNHLVIKGRMKDVVNVLRQSPWISYLYFRCFPSEQGNRLGILANQGFRKGYLQLLAGKPDEEVMLYIRQGTTEHACIQEADAFVLDGRTVL